MVDMGGLYQFVLGLVLIGCVLGVGIIVLDKFMGTTGISQVAIDAINKTIQAIADIPNLWLGLLVTIVILGIVIMVLVRVMGGAGRQ